MPALITALVLALLVAVPTCNAGAAIYSYKDDNGRTVFVDDGQKIPERHRGATTTIQEQRSQPAEEPAQGADAAPAEPPAKALVDRETQMRARQQAAQLDRQRAYQTPVMVRGNRVLVPVAVAGDSQTAHLMLLLDTGATTTVLHRPAVKELQFAPGEQIVARVAGGRTVKSEKVKTRHVDIGPFIIKDFPVLLITPQGSPTGFDGMLGMDFLKDHPYEIDYRNEIIHWKPGEK